MGKSRLAWTALVCLGLFLGFWLGRNPGALAASPATPSPSFSPLPSNTPLKLAVHSQPLVAQPEVPEMEPPRQLKTSPPPPPRPSQPERHILKVSPPPPAAAPARLEQAPQLPGASYPTAGGPPAALTFQPSTAAPQTPSLSPRDYVARAEAASQQLDGLIRRGTLRAEFIGTGHAGTMAMMNLVNNSGRTVSVHLYPGMILRPGDGQRVQPLMLNEETTITLAPGTSAFRDLQSFCMDSRVPAPAPDGPTAYRFSTHTRDGGPGTVRVFQVAQQLALTPTAMPEELQRQAVTQLAIWKSMHQPVGDLQQTSALGPWYYDRATRQSVLADVERVLRGGR
ncbi:MAG: hypothetical protein U0931_04350 [Vulcanimicrobiota bacterium]